MHHRPTDPCGEGRRQPTAEEVNMPAEELAIVKEELGYRLKERDEARDEIRFLKAEKMRLEREVSELKRKLYGNSKE